MTTPLGYQKISTLSSAVSLSVPTNTQTNVMPTYCVLVPLTQSVRYRDDGVAPTATTGIPLAVGVPFVYDGDLKAVQFIETAASAELNVAYYYGNRF